jgi:hypothetical protein
MNRSGGSGLPLPRLHLQFGGPNHDFVLEIYAGAGGVLSTARRGAIVIEMSTVLPETSQKLAELGREHVGRGTGDAVTCLAGTLPVHRLRRR